jgi:hypothetical protein
MSTQQIQIQPNSPPTASQPGVFSPQKVTANAGDNLTWVNNDSHDHWPAPSVANRTAWFAYQIPPGSESGDLALGPNTVTATVATIGSPTVLTTSGAAPATGQTVLLRFSPTTTPPGPWQTATNGKSFVATNLGANSCSIPLDSTGFAAPGAKDKITMAIPYTLNYVCALHPAETGSITVNPQP